MVIRMEHAFMATYKKSNLIFIWYYIVPQTNDVYAPRPLSCMQKREMIQVPQRYISSCLKIGYNTYKRYSGKGKGNPQDVGECEHA